MASSAPLEAVLFDVGGTLLAEHPSRASIYALAARERGIDIDDRAMRQLMYRIARDLPRSINGHFRYSEGWFAVLIRRIFHERLELEADRLPELERELIGRFRDPATFRLFPGALELLDALRERGLGTGIVSNWSERLPEILEGLGVLERVDFVVCSAIEGCEKPEPEIFQLALERAGVAAERSTHVVHVGNDLVLDVRGAMDAGILPILIDHGGRGTWPKELEPVKDLIELKHWILERAP